ncbi:hypothetical protein INR49_010004 [Caranx melampygus]|nr:hypothetical protein INR49_010004 [Caranx melampygus]
MESFIQTITFPTSDSRRGNKHTCFHLIQTEPWTSFATGDRTSSACRVVQSDNTVFNKTVTVRPKCLLGVGGVKVLGAHHVPPPSIQPQSWNKAPVKLDFLAQVGGSLLTGVTSSLL